MDAFERYEYVIQPKKNAKLQLRRGLLLASYVLFVLLWLVFGLLTRILVPLLALIPLTTWMLVFFTWRYVNVEYEYVAEAGILTISRIYGGRSRKTVLTLDMRDVLRVLPAGEKATARAVDEFDPQHEFYFVSSLDSAEAYAVFCSDENGDNCVVYLQLIDKALRSFRLYNAAALQQNHGG